MIDKPGTKKDGTDKASAHFRWDELLVSGGGAKIAAAYRAKYPNGAWPSFLDPAIWKGQYTTKERDYMAARVRPALIQGTIADNMRAHLTNLVEPLRAYLGMPLKIISGWRPPELNKCAGVGCEKYSSHMLGIATDIQCTRTVTNKAKIWAHNQDKQFHNVGLFITYPWGFHISSIRGFSDHYFK